VNAAIPKLPLLKSADVSTVPSLPNSKKVPIETKVVSPPLAIPPPQSPTPMQSAKEQLKSNASQFHSASLDATTLASLPEGNKKKKEKKEKKEKKPKKGKNRKKEEQDVFVVSLEKYAITPFIKLGSDSVGLLWDQKDLFQPHLRTVLVCIFCFVFLLPGFSLSSVLLLLRR
jgi:hypothetical protein